MALNDDIPNGEEDEDDIENNKNIITTPPLLLPLEESRNEYEHHDLTLEEETQFPPHNKEKDIEMMMMTNEELPKSKTEDVIEITLINEEQITEVTSPQPSVLKRTCNPQKLGTTGIIRLVIVILLIATLIIVFILTLIPNSPITKIMKELLEWIEGIPLYGKVIALLLLYCITSPIGIPISPINLASGFLFHFWFGLVVAIIGCMSGAEICYWCGRTLLYTWTINKMKESKMLRAISLAVNTKAIKLIILTHISPLFPSSFLHYTFAAMGVDIVKFSIGTMIGISPFLVISVYIGSISRDLTTALSGDDRSSLISDVAWILFVVVVSVINFTIIGWYGKKELKKALSALDALENNTSSTSTPTTSETELVTLSQIDNEDHYHSSCVELTPSSSEVEKNDHHHTVEEMNRSGESIISVHHIDIEGTV